MSKQPLNVIVTQTGLKVLIRDVGPLSAVLDGVLDTINGVPTTAAARLPKNILCWTYQIISICSPNRQNSIDDSFR